MLHLGQTLPVTGVRFMALSIRCRMRYLCTVFAALIDNRGPRKMVSRHGKSVMALHCVANNLKLGSAYLRSGQTQQE